MKNLFIVLFSIVSFVMTSCAITSTMPELVKKETVITNIYFTESPMGLMQTVECEDGHIVFLKTRFFSPEDIGSLFVYFYPEELNQTPIREKEFVECNILSITEERGELVSKMLVTYNDSSSEYYDLFLPGNIYEDMTITNNFSLSKKEFYDVLKYNIRYNKIEGWSRTIICL